MRRQTDKFLISSSGSRGLQTEELHTTLRTEVVLFQEADRPVVRQLQFRPRLGTGTAPLNTANWDADEGQTWTVPLGIGISKTTVFNGRPMSLGAQYYYNVKRPDGTAATQLGLVVSLLYPIAKK